MTAGGDNGHSNDRRRSEDPIANEIIPIVFVKQQHIVSRDSVAVAASNSNGNLLWQMVEWLLSVDGLLIGFKWFHGYN